MAGGWQTKAVSMVGGLQERVPLVQQGMSMPGSLVTAINFEPSSRGGYRRVTGYSKYRPDAVPGTGEVQGLIVTRDGCLAARGNDVYYGNPTTPWTKINTDTRSAAVRVSFVRYNWFADTIVICDGVNRPAKWDGTTYTVLSAAPLGASSVCEFRTHLFFAKDSLLTWSAPANDANYTATDGAGVLNVGFPITGLAAWRGALYIFGRTSIKKLTGTTFADFTVEPVTTGIGCVAGHTIQDVNGDLVFLAADGLRTIAGTDRIGDVNLDNLSKPVEKSLSDTTRAYLTGGDIFAVVVHSKAQYRLMFARPNDGVFGGRGVLGGMRNDPNGMAWEWFNTLGFWGSCADSAYTLTGELVLMGGYTGYVYELENGTSFDGVDIPAILQTAHMAFDDPTLRKTLYKLHTEVELEGELTVTVQPVFEFEDYSFLQPPEFQIGGDGAGGAFFDAVSTRFDDTGAGEDRFDQSPQGYFTSYLEGSAKFIGFRFVTSGASPSYTIKTLTIEYSLGGRN